jgi:hypothetical protein
MTEKSRPTVEEWRLVWVQLKDKYLQQDEKWRLLRIVDEVGDAAKALTYKEYYSYSGGYNAELKKALSDIIATTYMAAFCFGFNIEEVERIGIEELKDAIMKRLPK